MEKPLAAYRGDLPYVFVCYAHADMALVYPEIRQLQDRGIRLWYDEGISAGRIWRQEIGDAILGARHFVYYISHHALQSDHCSRELHLALDEAKDVVPIYLENVALTSDLRVGLSRVHALFRWRDADYLQHLEQALRLRADDRTGASSSKGLQASRERSIAVLPFANWSSDAAQDYLCDGISEELLNLLTKIPELRVISRTSAFSFRGQNLEVTEIARRLNVTHILEGSVRKSGTRVRIAAQLIDARSDRHLWSETFDRTLDDIFAIQDEIAATVVRQLRITLEAEAPKVAQTDPKAYSLFLQASHIGNQGTPESIEQSSMLYMQVLAIDPNYVPASIGLAVNYMNEAVLGLRSVDDGYGLAEELGQRLLGIDSESAAAHDLLGRIAMNYANDLAGAAKHFERAMELEPKDGGIVDSVARMLVCLGRVDAAIALQEKEASVDPVNPLVYHNLAASYHTAGRGDEAITSYRTALRLSPGFVGVHYSIGLELLCKGDPDAALNSMRSEPLAPVRLVGLAMAHHDLRQTAESNAALEELIKTYELHWTYYIASVLAYRNERDRSFEWLAKAVKLRDLGLTSISFDSRFKNLHDDARWSPFLESIGKSPRHLAAIAFNVTVPK